MATTAATALPTTNVVAGSADSENSATVLSFGALAVACVLAELAREVLSVAMHGVLIACGCADGTIHLYREAAGGGCRVAAAKPPRSPPRSGGRRSRVAAAEPAAEPAAKRRGGGCRVAAAKRRGI